MRSLLIMVFLIVVLFTERASSQILPNDQKILAAVFEDERIKREVFTDKYRGENSVYIFGNNLILSRVQDHEKLGILMANDDAGAALLFFTSKGSIRLFSGYVQASAASKFSIDKIVVVDRFYVKQGSAILTFHTTNLDSKAWHKTNNSTAKFFRFKCFLKPNGTEWKITKIDISDFRFKPLI